MLFVLLCFAGELERADKQLDVIASMDEKTMTGGVDGWLDAESDVDAVLGAEYVLEQSTAASNAQRLGAQPHGE